MILQNYLQASRSLAEIGSFWYIRQTSKIRSAIIEAISGGANLCATFEVIGRPENWIQFMGQVINAAYPYDIPPQDKIASLNQANFLADNHAKRAPGAFQTVQNDNIHDNRPPSIEISADPHSGLSADAILRDARVQESLQSLRQSLSAVRQGELHDPPVLYDWEPWKFASFEFINPDPIFISKWIYDYFDTILSCESGCSIEVKIENL